MSSQMRAFYDEVEIWVDDVIQHTANILPFNKSEEHSDPLNILGDQELNIPRPHRPLKRKRAMSGNGSPSKGLATRQSPRRKAPLDLASISLQPSESSARGRSPTKRSPTQRSPTTPSPTKQLPTKEQDQISKHSSDHEPELIYAPLPDPSEGVSSSRWKRKSSKSPSHFVRNMAYLESCDPPIVLRTVEDFKSEVRGELPPHVHYLVEDLYFKATDSVIPHKLKDHYESLTNTPSKSKKPIPSYHYLKKQQDINLKPFQTVKVEELPGFVDGIIEEAARNAYTNAHERQWSISVVAPLLRKVLEWGYQREIRLLNVEQVGISPKQFQVERSSGKAAVLDIASNTSASKDTESCMIDMQYGFSMHKDDNEALRKGYRKLPRGFQSINQTTVEFTRDVPTFVDFELKRGSIDDPKYQLAVWGAGLYLKRKHHEWDVSMPIVGVTIESHRWECFLLFEHGEGFWHGGEGLVMMGPIELGNTKSIHGVFKILFNLEYITIWGLAKWKPWFNSTVMDWMRRQDSEKREESADQ